ncbi:MAG: lysophospholipid acyltransferase family protein [Planctomycetes bacterium]|nr:lysophospholipid acyltransferase family protein [Planctomycetota bacterium]
MRNPREFTLLEKWKYGFTSAAARTLIRVVTQSCRWKLEGDHEVRANLLHGRQNYIFLLWHNRVPAFFAYSTSISNRNPTVLFDSIVSASHDGEILARPIRELGGGEIRGSSSRDAARALREAVERAKRGSTIATVGDGPRGPRYRLKPGPILLAKETGVPIVLMTWAGSRVLQMHRAWDQLMIPLPRSTITARFGEPFHVPADASPRRIAGIRRELETRLGEMTKWADANTRVAVQFPKPKEAEVLKRRKKIELVGRHFEE